MTPRCPDCNTPLVYDCAEWHRYSDIETDEDGEITKLDAPRYLTDVETLDAQYWCPSCAEEKTPALHTKATR